MRKLVDYCEEFLQYEDGVLYWKKGPSPRVVVGAPTGRLRKDGYVDVKIMGKRYLAHRIVWLIHYGELPAHTIDHIDRDRSNNRIENLRDVTLSINLTNSGKGYYWCNREKRFMVYKRKDGKRYYVGRYINERDAQYVACEA